MLCIYAIPVTAVDPDNAAFRTRIAPDRLEQLDLRHGSARQQSFAAMLLLEYAVAQHFPAIAHPLSLSIAEGGKPFLPAQPEIYFSLSHSSGWAVCALSDRAVGVDIERREPGRRDVAQRFFHQDEIAYLNSLPPRLREDTFYSLWVLKEAFVKATGSGLNLPLRSFCVNIQNEAQPTLQCDETDLPYSLSLLPFAADFSYRLAVCTEGAQRETPVLEVLS